MALHCCTGAWMRCSMGSAPASFNATARTITASGAPAGNIQDHAPMMHITPFGLCRSPVNPMVAAATAAASGTLTPQPCIPATATPWSPGASTVLVGGMPALNDDATLACMWAGTITWIDAGQVAVTVA